MVMAGVTAISTSCNTVCRPDNKGGDTHGEGNKRTQTAARSNA